MSLILESTRLTPETLSAVVSPSSPPTSLLPKLVQPWPVCPLGYSLIRSAAGWQGVRRVWGRGLEGGTFLWHHSPVGPTCLWQSHGGHHQAWRGHAAGGWVCVLKGQREQCGLHPGILLIVNPLTSTHTHISTYILTQYGTYTHKTHLGLTFTVDVSAKCSVCDIF